MSIFEPLELPHYWQPSELAAGPFQGLQGGAVASLLTAEMEAMAVERNWGFATSASAWFLRPTPLKKLRTQLTVQSDGGRVSVIDNTLWPDGEAAPSATVRLTFLREREIALDGFQEKAETTVDPLQFPVRTHHRFHDKPWFLDAMDVRTGGDGVTWFRPHHSIIEGAGSLSSVLGPADWTHGIERPLDNVVADPNPNLTVQLFRQFRGEWVGVQPHTRWQPKRGLGLGRGVLFDIYGEMGCVSMSVVLLPFKTSVKNSNSEN